MISDEKILTVARGLARVAYGIHRTTLELNKSAKALEEYTKTNPSAGLVGAVKIFHMKTKIAEAASLREMLLKELWEACGYNRDNEGQEGKDS